MVTAFEKEHAEEIRQSAEMFLANPYWRRYREDAPSEACRRYIDLEFYDSDEPDDDPGEVMRFLEEEALTADDLRYLMKRNKGPVLARYQYLIGKKENGAANGK